MENQNVSLFENARSAWTLQVTGPEMRRVMQTLVSMEHRVKDPIIWVQKVGPATRRWWSNSFKLNVHFDTAGTDSDPVTPVAIPRSFLAAVNQLTNTYGTAEIFLNQAEQVLTAESGGEYVAMDETLDVNTPPPFEPLFMDRVSSHHRWERISVRTDVLRRIIDQYNSMQFTVKEIEGPPSFINLNANHDTLRWTTDWSRWGRPRMSGLAAASTYINRFDVSFYPETLFSYLSGMPFDEEVVIGTVDADYSDGTQWFAVIGLDWAAWCPVEDENWERWGPRIHASFEEFGFEHIDEPEWWMFEDEGEFRQFLNDDVSIRVSIVDGSAGPDCVRLRYEAMHEVILTVEVLEEVMTLNNELVNARLTLDGSEMAIIVDVDNPGEQDVFGDAIKSMLAAIGKVSSVDELLPLFGGNRPKDDLDREIDEILGSLDEEDGSDEDPDDFDPDGD